MAARQHITKQRIQPSMMDSRQALSPDLRVVRFYADMILIKCTICKEEKSPESFSKCRAKKNGLRCQCKKCDANDVLKNKERHRLSVNQNYIKNRNKILANKKLYKEKNLEKRLEIQRRSAQKNRKKTREKEKLRRNIDPVIKLKTRISASIRCSIKRKGYAKNSRTHEILGCDYEFFKNYIEAQFKKGMHWDNIHLDHIKPLKYAKTEDEVLQHNHYSNFQPLFIRDNLRKSAKLITKQLRLI